MERINREREKRYQECVEKLISWLVTQQQADGSFDSDPNVFYKIPWAFSTWGRQMQATRLLDWSKDKAFEKTWRFAPIFSGKDRFPWPTKNTGGECTMAYIYAYLQIGSQLLGRFDFAYGLMKTVLSYQDTTYGGFYGKRIGRSEGEMDLMTTAFCGLSCLYSGRHSEAKRAADFLVKMKELQPDPNRKLYVSLRDSGKPVTDFAEEDAACYVLDTQKPGQMYIFPGAAIINLCKTYMAIPKPEFLDTAKSYYELVMGWDDIWETPRSGKFAVGCSCLYKITGDPEYLQTATRIADYVVGIQNEDGSWPAPPGYAESWTAEFGVHLAEILKNTSTA